MDEFPYRKIPKLECLTFPKRVIHIRMSIDLSTALALHRLNAKNSKLQRGSTSLQRPKHLQSDIVRRDYRR
jgi:hypothetical protein